MNILNPTNRLDYGTLLMPPEGFKTSFAVGTTYSLDLETMLHVPLALFHSKYLSEATDIRNLRADMLDALQQVKGKVIVFVHADNIHVSTKYNILYNFLDQSIVNVLPDNEHSNFHPKVWLIRYEKGKDFCYRLIVMSRNLSPSEDFDVAASFDSFPSTKVKWHNDNLVAFCEWLMRKTKNKQIIRTIRKELKTIRFDVPKPFDYNNFDFFPHTIKELGLENPFKNVGVGRKYLWEDCLVISPFLKDDSLKEILQKTTGDCWLVSRKEELDSIDGDTLRQFTKVYQFISVDEVDSANDDLSETERNVGSVNLHAKLYIVRAKLPGEFFHNFHWYLGSTNCTNAAFENNVEALVHLKASYKCEATASPRSVIEALSDPKTGIFQEYHISNGKVEDKEQKNKEYRIRKLKWLISSLHIKGTYENVGNNKYTITSVVGNKEKLEAIRKQFSDMKVLLQLFCYPKGNWNLMTDDHHVFKEAISCQTISPLLKISIQDKDENCTNYILLMEMELPKERTSKMMAEILDSEDKVMKYLMFLLDDNMSSDELDLSKPNKESKLHDDKGQTVIDYKTPILEKMLLASSRNPQALSRMKETIDRMNGMKDIHGNPLLSKEFLNLWNNFKGFAK